MDDDAFQAPFNFNVDTLRTIRKMVLRGVAKGTPGSLIRSWIWDAIGDTTRADGDEEERMMHHMIKRTITRALAEANHE